MIFRCRICGNDSGNREHIAREMMIGTRDTFTYVECSQCGCLQIKDVPENLADYYAAKYYSLGDHSNDPWLIKPDPALLAFLKRHRAMHHIDGSSIIGRTLTTISNSSFDNWEWLRGTGVRPDSRILDVGCGGGELLLRLKKEGFISLMGIDPYLPNDKCIGGVRLIKADISHVQGEFDFIMFHHSLEHMSDQCAALKAANRLLVPRRSALVRIPLVGGYAWRHYGVDWVQLDAPRHLFLHTMRSLALSAEEAGFSVERAWYDSGPFQFYGSEQYQNDIPLTDERSYWVNGLKNSIFEKTQIDDYTAHAARLNREEDGDCACFLLRK